MIGFRIPGTNQIVTEIRTGENATNSYELVVRVGPGEGMNCHPHQATYYPMMFLGQMSI